LKEAAASQNKQISQLAMEAIEAYLQDNQQPQD
jgi:hypothetical protein